MIPLTTKQCDRIWHMCALGIIANAIVAIFVDIHVSWPCIFVGPLLMGIMIVMERRKKALWKEMFGMYCPDEKITGAAIRDQFGVVWPVMPPGDWNDAVNDAGAQMNDCWMLFLEYGFATDRRDFITPETARFVFDTSIAHAFDKAAPKRDILTPVDLGWHGLEA